ncbi:MAG: hypothetical protein V2I57_15370, partial [Xanthomonadales bacterium]|nr:hypothetical protein [Xanthomonadales bacterium]
MQLVALLLGIALPWVTGALALRAARNGSLATPEPGQGLLAAGAGLFLGLALTTWLLRLSAAWTGTFSWWFVMAVLALMGAGLAWLGRKQTAPSPATKVAGPAERPGGKWLVILLLLATLAHLSFSGLELLTQPLFPWDGWTVWVYRAKAWFFAEQITPVVDPQQWLAASNPEIYSTPARAYPLIPSLVPLWTALSLGAWHEAWVNLPVIAAGIGLCLGLAGLLRQSGVGVPGTIVGVYLLVSTPILGVHLSLGGYGDIWMAAYAGLGMAALLAGLTEDRRCLVLLGFVLLTLGLGVKVEGWVWLVTGFAVFALVRLPGRWLVAAAVGLAVILLAVAMTGGTVFDIPGLGRIGYRDGLLYLPIKGIITLQRHDVVDAYRINAFQLGSWHLLWFMMLMLFAALLVAWRSRLARAGLAFLFVFVALQAVIFGFTTEGAWARDYTAINRMPLQMLPALLFLLVLGAERALRQAPPVNSKAWILAGTGAVLLTIGGAVAWLSAQQTGNPV